ncbi:MAG: methyltransferase, CheR family protein [Bacilli bacterium]|nr:methyltransferase, CheR family protein [Bacilli bacterium]
MFRADLLEEDVELILTEIYSITGYNFKNYSAVIVMRRLQRRLISEGITNLSALLNKIKNNPNYAFQLIADFSINVTEMFRNPHFFRYFREHVISQLKEKDFIRIWAAGCSTGEEVYSLAILLHEEGIYHRCRIYATDMNESIILQAKSGSISIKKMQDYSNNYISAGGSEQLNQYFHFKDGTPYLRTDLMRNILFSHHNLVTDRSFNEFHVIFCRNVLIYFNHWLRNHVHSLLFDSLALNGYLALGDREAIRFTQYAPRYINLNPQEKIYQRVN